MMLTFPQSAYKAVGYTLATIGCAHYLYLSQPTKTSAGFVGLGCALGCYLYFKSEKTELNQSSNTTISSVTKKRDDTLYEVLFFPDELTIDSEMCDAPKEKRAMMYKTILYENANKGGASFRRLSSRLSSATETIDVCLFNITNDQLTHSVLDQIKKGVKVRLIVDGSASESSQVGKFRAAGAFVRPSWNLSSNDYLMHHKFAIVDNTILITGSFNWTMQAVMGNKENIIVTSEPLLLQPFVEEFKKLWTEFDPNPKAFSDTTTHIMPNNTVQNQQTNMYS